MPQTEQESRDDSPPGPVASPQGAEGQRQCRSSGQYRHVIPSELHIFIPVTMVFILLLMTAVASLGAISIFVPLFVGVVIAYVFGSLYLFKKLMTY